MKLRSLIRQQKTNGKPDGWTVDLHEGERLVASGWTAGSKRDANLMSQEQIRLYQTKLTTKEGFYIESISPRWTSSVSAFSYPTAKRALQALRSLISTRGARQYHLWQGDKIIGTWNADGKRIHVIQA